MLETPAPSLPWLRSFFSCGPIYALVYPIHTGRSSCMLRVCCSVTEKLLKRKRLLKSVTVTVACKAAEPVTLAKKILYDNNHKHGDDDNFIILRI
jgi:hypothetical protein